jgi:hypothetical protein
VLSKKRWPVKHFDGNNDERAVPEKPPAVSADAVGRVQVVKDTKSGHIKKSDERLRKETVVSPM